MMQDPHSIWTPEIDGAIESVGLPETALWAAVLQRGLADVCVGVLMNSDQGLSMPKGCTLDLLEEASEWFSSNAVGVGSFLWVCDVCGVDPDRLRAELQRRPMQVFRSLTNTSNRIGSLH